MVSSDDLYYIFKSQRITCIKQKEQMYFYSLMPFSSSGLHTYQRVYGCVWDNETEESQGFDKYSYDGRDFISLGVKERTYTAHVPQAEPTVEKWNNDRTQLTLLKRYYEHECIYWLKEFLKLRKAGFKRRGALFLRTSLCSTNR